MVLIEGGSLIPPSMLHPPYPDAYGTTLRRPGFKAYTLPGLVIQLIYRYLRTEFCGMKTCESPRRAGAVGRASHGWLKYNGRCFGYPSFEPYGWGTGKLPHFSATSVCLVHTSRSCSHHNNAYNTVFSGGGCLWLCYLRVFKGIGRSPFIISSPA